MTQLITHEELVQVTNCTKLSELEKTLREQKIQYFYGKKGRLWTTLTALNAALGVGKGESNDDNIEFR